MVPTLLLVLYITTLTSETILSEATIQFINTNQTSWIAGPNFPEDTPIELLRRRNGALHDADFYNNLEENIHNITEEIPEFFDAREQWPQCESLGMIRNQGHCGSCWAFGAVESMTDRLCIATNGTEKFQFSAENLLSCCTDCGSGCNGGYSSKAWIYWVNNGIVSGGDHNSTQGCQPYTTAPFENSTTPQCTTMCHNEYPKSYEEDKHYGASTYRIIEDVEQIQAEIISNGPVQASYAVYDDFYHYKSGVYQHTTGNKSGHHSVKILGWGVENGTSYWLIANSWGTEWGDMGFFKILRGENHCGIEENVVGGRPRLN